jgi:threonyl-tRNA synthetase
MLVVGDREAENDAVSVREHRAGDTGTLSVQDFAERVLEQTRSRSAG